MAAAALSESQPNSSHSPLLPQFGHMVTSSFGFVRNPTRGSIGASAAPSSAMLHRTSLGGGTTATGSTAGGGGHVALVAGPEERVEELVQRGQSRREALRQVTRENMDAEVREGLNDTLQSGALPGCARACGLCCGILIVFLLLLCIGIWICCVAMHFAGWFLTWWLLGCGHQHELRRWLFLYQILYLLEACFASLIRGCVQEVTETLDSRVRPGFTRACAICYTVLSSSLKVFWCIHVQALVSAVPREPGCGESLPRFMSWYSCVLLLQLLVVEPFIRLSMSFVMWAAASGFIPTTRGAKPGTLEMMQAVEYNAELFADSNDLNDARPQKECCFCLEEYDRDSAIIKTPCQHLMHRECLARWLQTSHFCPICRGDLEDGRLP